MKPKYPKDSDGDSLRQLAADGNDMNSPMDVDFPVVIPAEIPAKKFASLASSKGYNVHLWRHEDDGEWDVICSRNMVPTYDDIVGIQKELSQLAKPLRGYCDSWGTFGNKAGAQPGAG